MMTSLKINILNPKALSLLKNLEDLKLIELSEDLGSGLKDYLRKLRKNSSSAPKLNEISQLVSEVRAERYGKKKKS